MRIANNYYKISVFHLYPKKEGDDLAKVMFRKFAICIAQFVPRPIGVRLGEGVGSFGPGILPRVTLIPLFGNFFRANID